MNYCTECGNEINITDKFCGQCGASLSNTDKKNKSWIKKICKWAKDNNISELQEPQNYESLLKITTLDISNKKLSELPKELFNLTNLEQLLASENSLMHLPKEIEKLKKLSILDLSRNTLYGLPDEVGNLSNLSSINLSFNDDLTELPDNIGNLTNLIKLYIACPNLDYVPMSITNLIKLEYLSICESTNIRRHDDEYATWLYRLLENNCDIVNHMTDDVAWGGVVMTPYRLNHPITYSIKVGRPWIDTLFDPDTDQFHFFLREDRQSEEDAVKAGIRVHYKDNEWKVFKDDKWQLVKDL
jgi:hypothetical protein